MVYVVNYNPNGLRGQLHAYFQIADQEDTTLKDILQNTSTRFAQIKMRYKYAMKCKAFDTYDVEFIHAMQGATFTSFSSCLLADLGSCEDIKLLQINNLKD